MLYRLVLISCLSILKYVSKHVEQHLILAVGQEEADVKTVLKYWQDMAILSLKNSIPYNIWTTMSVSDWEQAMKLLSKLEHIGENNEV